MQEKNTVGRINDQPAARAAGWYARLRAPDCTAAERREFDAWMAEDERHRRAFEAASCAARRVSDALRLDPRLRAMLEDDASVRVAAPAWRRSPRRVAVAAGLVAAVGVAALSMPVFHGGVDAPVALASFENTGSREKAITLRDGSVVHLDAGAQVNAELLAGSRRISLLRGRAYFEVAHDAARPFSVEASGTRTVALGTRFEVKLEPQGVSVTLAEGAVAVTPTEPGAQWKRTLSPGQQLVLDADRPDVRVRDVDALQVVAWSQGRLVFDGDPLSSVLAEVNRYSTIKVVLGDERLAAIPIGGTFVAGGDAGAFVQALSAILPLRSEPSGDHEIVLFHRERPPAAN
jgi:transmembrane sensor